MTHDPRMHWAGCYGLLSEILGKGALSHYGDEDLIDRVKQACQDFENAHSKLAQAMELYPDRMEHHEARAEEVRTGRQRP